MKKKELTISPGTFLLLLIIAAYVGLLPHSTSTNIPQHLQPNDKFLHLITFFLISLVFYWVFETSRRRAVHLSVGVCTLALGVGSEFIQGVLPNGRAFDLFDLIANLVGSLGAIGLCGWYHRRMLERRRHARYGSVSADGANADDVELGVTGRHHGDEDDDDLGPQENGVTSLEQEVDNWDENAVDNWDTEDGIEEPEDLKKGSGAAGPGPAVSGEGAGKKRSD